jgi:tetratricopeptide (TPR) repeat protein
METITSRLSQFEGTKSTLVVVPASEVRAQEAKTAGDAKKKFQVTEAVEGTVQSQGDRIRLLLTVIDAKEMRQAETIVVDGQRSNALQLQDEAVTKLANALNLRLQPEYAREQQDMIPIAPGAYEFYLLARGYLQRSDQMQSLESAITLLKRALALDPQYALAHSGLGQAYLYKYELTRDPKLMDEALKSGREGLTLNSGLAETHISMGRIHLGTGRYKEALQDFEHATSLDSRNNEAYQGLANAYAKLKDYARAEATYRKAISLRPGDWTGYRHLGIFYLEREEFDKAIAQYEKVIELSPDNAHGYVNLGAFHTRKENWAEAEKYFLRALELDPTRMSTLTNLAKVYYERGQFDRAIEYYKRALALNDRSRLSWGNLGLTYWRKGDQENGRPALEKALQLLDAELLVNPKLADLHSYVGYYRAVLGREDYQQPLRMALKLDPDNGDVAARAAEAYAIRGDKERAIELIKQIIAKGSNIKSLQRSRDLRGLLSGTGILASK